jgi:protease I
MRNPSNLNNAGHEIINVESRKKLSGKQGLEVQIDKTFREVTADDFDAVFIPGGFHRIY